MMPSLQAPPGQVSPFGIGIVPPARNFADSPETAVTVGSARVRATPCCSKACRVAREVLPPPTVQPSVALFERRRAVDAERICEVRALVTPLHAADGQ